MAADVFMRPAQLLGATEPLSPRTEPDEDSSDTDDGGASPGGGRRCGPRRGQPPGPQIIHSGHFMVSSPHSEHPPKKGYDFDTVNEQTCQTYQFGAARGDGGAGGRLSIDASLTKLFECMSLAYSGKLVSPKWKNFKGLKLQWRDKIRLNNAIWRAWYMQYLEKRKNPVCHFVTPLDGSVDVDEHRRPEAIATDGKYWKRRIEIVIREYHKWRTYFKKRLQKHKDEDLSSLVRDDDVVLWQKRRYGRETPVPMEEGSLLDADMLMSEFTDTLFSTLSSHQLVVWPNSRDIAHLGNADMIQPGLIPLQPNFDFMDTFEPFQDLFTPSRSSNYFPSVSAASPATTDSSSHSSQSPVLPSDSLPNTLSAGNMDDGLIASSVPAPVVPDVGTDQCSSIRSEAPFIQPADFTPNSSLSGPQTFMPVFQTPLPLLQPATQQQQSPLPAVPLNSSLSSPSPAFAAPESQNVGLSESTVVTHTASATLTHNAPATTFSQSQNLVVATQQPGTGVTCNMAFQTTVLQGQPWPQLQFQLTFALPKAVPLASAATRPKQSQKVLPAPKPETVSLLLKNAFITPDLFTPSRSSNYFPSVSAASPATTDSSSHSSQSPVLPSDSLPNTLSAGNMDDGLIASSVPAPVIPDVGTDQCSSIRSEAPFIQPADFTPNSSFSGPQTFMPVFQTPLPLLQPATQQQQSPLPAVPLNSSLSSPSPAFAAPESQNVGLSESTVVTHTASATLTHNAPATTFSQSQNLVVATQQPGTGVTCNMAFQTTVLQGQPWPQLQFQLTFALPKAVPLASAATRPKQSQKVLPAPKPETVSLLLKNAFITPAAFQGQSRTVIATPPPLKREGILTPATSQSNVAIAPAGIVRAPGVTEFRSNILAGPAQREPSSQQSQSTVSHLFSPSVAQDVLVKGEQIPSHSSSSQVPSPTPSRDCQNSGQASPCTSEHSPSPQSPQNNCSGKPATDPAMAAFKNRRMKHISEQKRRFNIKIGFSTLNSLVSANSKSISHAITLQKTVEYIAKLQQERTQMQEEARRLREEIEELNAAIISCQQQLPATGVPIAQQRFDHMRRMFNEYVRSRAQQNWKFWIFSIIIKPLFESFNGMVSRKSFKDLNQTAMAWLDQHCSLPVLRPMVLNTLRHLSTTTSILSDPSRLPEQAAEAVNKMNKSAGET